MPTPKQPEPTELDQPISPTSLQAAIAAHGRARAVQAEQPPAVDPSTMIAAPPSYPKLRPNSLWWWVFDPKRWGVLGQGENLFVCPLFRELRATGGRCGVRERILPDGTPDPDLSQALENLKFQGCYLVPHDIDGPDTSYVRRVRVGTVFARNGARVPQWHWHSMFATPRAGSDVLEVDHVAYGAWVRGLLDAGKLPPADPYILERLAQQAQRQLDMAIKRNPRDPDHPTIKHRRAALEVIHREIVASAA